MKHPRIRLTEDVVVSLEALLASQVAASCLLTPAERGVKYVTSLVRRRRGGTDRRVRFDMATADSLGALILKCRPVAEGQELALDYLLQQVEHYRSDAGAAARAREVRRVQSYKHKEADGA